MKTVYTLLKLYARNNAGRRNADDEIFIADSDNPLAEGKSAIVSQGNVTLTGEKIYDKELDNTFFTCWVRSGEGAYVAGVPVIMEGYREEDESKTLKATKALIKNVTAMSYAPHTVQMYEDDIAVLDGCYIGWYRDIPLFSAGPVSIRNPFASWGTLEGLVFKDADYSSVDEAIAAIPADLSVYTEATANAVTAAKNAAVRGKSI